MSGACGKFWG